MSNINKTISELVDDYGMQIVLQALIYSLKGYEEDYLVKLKKDLEVAMKNYLDRYADEIDEEDYDERDGDGLSGILGYPIGS